MPKSAISIDDLLVLMPPEGRLWIRFGALAYERSLKMNELISCPYSAATDESEFWYVGYIGAQCLNRYFEIDEDPADFAFADHNDSHPH